MQIPRARAELQQEMSASVKGRCVSLRDPAPADARHDSHDSEDESAASRRANACVRGLGSFFAAGDTTTGFRE